MQYISPASLFDDAKQFTLDKKAIQLGRKKLLAELELSGAGSIRIKGISFAKNDIIDYFDDLLEGQSAAYHRAIEEDSVLKTFLEGYVIEQWSAFKENDLYDDPAFILWISSWFFSSFTAYVDDCFEERDDEGLRTILINRLLMTGPDTERAWLIITQNLNDHISLLNDYQRQDKRAVEKISMQSISHFMEFLYIKMIQLLPESRFGGIRDKYAFAMMQACIYTFNRNVDNRYQARTWMDNAILLAVSEELKTELSDKLEEMNRISTTRQKRKTSSLEWRVAFFALVAVIRLAATCNSSSLQSTYQFKNAPVFITHPGDTLKHPITPSEIDSMLRKNPNTVPYH
jgi:hypothetical protein